MHTPSPHLMEVLSANAALISGLVARHCGSCELEFVRARFYSQVVTDTSPAYVSRLQDIASALGN